MKSLLLLLFIASGLLSAQEIRFEEVVKIDSTASKEELFNRARTWFGNNFRNEKDVISISDKESGEISGNGSLFYKPTKVYFGVLCTAGDVHFKINIYIKDGRFKYVIHSLSHEGSFCNGGNPINCGPITNEPDGAKHSKCGKKALEDIRTQSELKIKSLISSLKTEMNSKYENNNNW